VTTPEGKKRVREYLELAALDRIHTYWREHWTFDGADDPPFPFRVYAADDDRGRGLLARLDAMGLPYHHLPNPDRDNEMLATYISAPLWPRPEGIIGGQAFGMQMPEWELDYLSLDDFFAHFQPREAPSQPAVDNS
jgi:hypothetical protein